jgi:AraC-like DNA-binding protein
MPVSGQGVAIHFVRSALSTRGPDDVRRALREAGLTPAAVRGNAERVGCDEAAALLRSLWRLTDDELLGFGPRPVPLGTFRMIALGLIHVPDLRTALERLVQFAAITTGYTRCALVVDGASCRLEFAADPAVVDEPLAVDLVLAFAHWFAAWLTGQRIVLSGLGLPFAEPAHAGEYHRIFGVAPTFRAPVAFLGFDAAHLSAPVVRAEPDLEAFLRDSPADLVFHRAHTARTADRVRQALERGEPGRAQRAEDVAARLSISVQHLRRLLRQEGTSFQEIRTEVLRDIAVASLARGRESVDDLSRRLGFSEPSAFRRAFARWVGSPPGAYRSHHAARNR